MITYKKFYYKEHQLTLSAIELFSIQKIEQCDLSDDIVNQLIEWDLAFADRVIVASENDIVVGFFRYDIGNSPDNIYAAGTYVIPEYRNKGLAFSLWEEMIKLEQPKQMWGHVESLGGNSLLNKIKSQYFKINYDFTFSNKIIDNKISISRADSIIEKQQEG